MVEVFPPAAWCLQFGPRTGSQGLGFGLAFAGEEVFEAQAERRLRQQRIQDHVRQEIRTESISHAERRVETETFCDRERVLMERLRELRNQLAVSSQPSHVGIARRRISRPARGTLE